MCLGKIQKVADWMQIWNPTTKVELVGGCSCGTQVSGNTDIKQEPSPAFFRVTVSEAALKSGLMLPATADAGFLKVVGAESRPVTEFTHNVAARYEFTDKFGRAVNAAYRGAVGYEPIAVSYDLARDDDDSGYKGIQKKSAIVFSLPPEP